MVRPTYLTGTMMLQKLKRLSSASPETPKYTDFGVKFRKCSGVSAPKPLLFEGYNALSGLILKLLTLQLFLRLPAVIRRFIQSTQYIDILILQALKPFQCL